MAGIGPALCPGEVMAKTTILRSQLDEADALFDTLLAAVDRFRGEPDSSDLAMKLARLAGLLRLQFALERETLYPRMATSGLREAEIMARLFQRELEPLARMNERFIQRWSSSKAVAGSFDQFRFEAGMLIAALRERNRRLRRDILPLADRAATAHSPWLARRVRPAASAATRAATA
jgi:hypothetical protein